MHMETNPFDLFEKVLMKHAHTNSNEKEIDINVVYLFQMIYEDRYASEIDFERFSIQDIERAQHLIEGNSIYVDDDFETVELMVEEFDYARQHSDHEYIVNKLFNDKKHSRFKETRRIFI